MASPVRVLSIEIKPLTLTMQVQDPTAPGFVNEYTYRALTGVSAMLHSSIIGPRAVHLNLINPNLEENLFDLTEVNFAAVADAAHDAVRRVALEGGGAVQSIHIQRQVGILPPSSGDIQWEIFVGGPRESASAYADAQGRVRRFNLSGTRRAQTLDYTKDVKTLEGTIAEIRDLFGSERIFNHVRVSRLDVAFSVRDSKNANETRGYNCDLNGIRFGFNDAMNIKLPGVTDEKREFFSIDDADWSRVAAMCKTALQKINLPHPNILSIELVKPPPKLKEQPLRWRAQVIEGAMGEYGFVEFDPKTGQVTRVEPPRSQEVKVDFLDLAKTQEFFANLEEDFDSAGQFLEVTILHDSAMVKALAPGKRDEIQRYNYTAKERANPEASVFNQSPFDQGFDQKDLFGVADLQGFEARLAELEKKTIDRLRIPDGTIKNLSFYRRSPFYPGNKKLLLEIWGEGAKGLSGRVVYDAPGAEFDAVTPSGPASEDTTPPDFKPLGTTDATADRVARFDTLFTSFLSLWKKYGDTRWGKMRVSAPDKVLTLPREEFRKWAKVQRELLNCVDQILKIFAEHQPPADAIMSSKAAAHTSKREFWEGERQVWDGSCQQSKLLDENWADWVAHGFPATETQYKPWQKEVMRLQGEINAAQQRLDALSPAHK
jgi:hypothetical protein